LKVVEFVVFGYDAAFYQDGMPVHHAAWCMHNHWAVADAELHSTRPVALYLLKNAKCDSQRAT